MLWAAETGREPSGGQRHVLAGRAGTRGEAPGWRAQLLCPEVKDPPQGLKDAPVRAERSLCLLVRGEGSAEPRALVWGAPPGVRVSGSRLGHGHPCLALISACARSTVSSSHVARSGIGLGSDPRPSRPSTPKPPTAPSWRCSVSVPDEDRSAEAWGRGPQEDTEAPTVWPPGPLRLKRCCSTSQPPSKVLSSILGRSNLQFAGLSVSLTISTASLDLRTPDSKQVCGPSGAPPRPAPPTRRVFHRGPPRLRAPRVCKTSTRLPT